MKTIKLTEEERERIKEIYELQQKATLFTLESKEKLATFWLEFNRRNGMGNYTLNTRELTVSSKSPEELTKEEINQ